MVEIVGREQQLALIEAFLTGRGPRSLVLEGEAGVGKSTLWCAGVEWAAERGFRVLSSRPVEAEQGLAFVGLGDLLDESLAEVLPLLSSPRRRALEAALLLVDAVPDAVDPRALGLAVRDALQALAENAPLLIAIDDVQWFDAASAAAVAFALRRIGDTRMRLLLARRSGMVLSVALDDASALAVGPLSVGALHRLLRDRLNRTFARQTLLRIHEHSGGNPFFALELARALDADVDITQPLPLPRTIEELLRDRIGPLPGPTRDALAIAAALGAPSLALLERMGIEERALDAALDAHVIDRQNGSIRFAHPLLSSVLYADLGDERRDLHRRIAAVVDDPLIRARHLALATESADADVARILDEAVRVAGERGATALAAELAEHALRLTDDDAQHRRALAAARAQQTAGEWIRARAIATDLLAQTGPGTARAEVLLLLAGLESENRAAELLEEALDEAGSSPALQSAIHARLAWAVRFRDGFVAALEQARIALVLAEQVDDNARRVDALKVLTITAGHAGDPNTRSYAERAYELAQTLDDDRPLKDAMIACAQAMMDDRIRRESTREFLENAYATWRERDEPVAADLLWYLAWTEFWSGRWERAAEYAAHQRDIKAQYGLELTVAYVPGAWIAVHRGELEVAREEATAALKLAHEHLGVDGPFALAITGLAALWSGDTAAGAAWLARADAQAKALGWQEPQRRSWTTDYVEALLALGHADEAARVVDRWQAEAVRLGRRWVLAQVLVCRGLIAAAAGDVDAAAGLLDDAVAQLEQFGDGFGRARALLAHGVVLRRARRKRPAREAIEAALEVFEQLGAATWAARARGELGSIGGRARERGLTAAERRVAALVVEGRTNAEVAAALFLTERTVAGHLTHIYAKLGVRSRTELARQL